MAATSVLRKLQKLHNINLAMILYFKLIMSLNHKILQVIAFPIKKGVAKTIP